MAESPRPCVEKTNRVSTKSMALPFEHPFATIVSDTGKNSLSVKTHRQHAHHYQAGTESHCLLLYGRSTDIRRLPRGRIASRTQSEMIDLRDTLVVFFDDMMMESDINLLLTQLLSCAHNMTRDTDIVQHEHEQSTDTSITHNRRGFRHYPTQTRKLTTILL